MAVTNHFNGTWGIPNVFVIYLNPSSGWLA